MVKRMLAASCAAILAVGATAAALAAAPAATPQVDDHFSVTLYADLDWSYGLNREPTALAVGPDGRVYVALESGMIYAFEDTDGDDRQDTAQLFGDEPPFPAGMVWRGSALYITFPDPSSPGDGLVRVLQDLDSDGDAFDDPETELFISGLPETVQGLAFDSAGRLYVSTAADCDSCTPPDLAWGAVLRFNADGSFDEYYALGLHDPHDLGFYPASDDLFAPDNGRDDLGQDAPPDEWNWVRQGRHYGWPHCWQGGADSGYEAWCSWAQAPLATFPAHSSPAGLAFHDGTAVPPAYAGSAFVALQDLGAVYRAAVTSGPGGYAAVAEPFAAGFESPVDVAVGPDGALYVADVAPGSSPIHKVYCIRALPDLSGSYKQAEPVAPEAGGLLTYTLYVASVGPGTSFTLTDPIPVSTTYVADSGWASAGTITETGGLVRWWGVVGANTTVTAAFAVQVDGDVPTRTAILNTATLTGTNDPDGPFTLQAVAIVGPERFYLPLTLRDN